MPVPGLPFLMIQNSSPSCLLLWNLQLVKFRGPGCKRLPTGPSPNPLFPWHDTQAPFPSYRTFPWSTISGEAVFVEPKGGTSFLAHILSLIGTLDRKGCTSSAWPVAGPVNQLSRPTLTTSRHLLRDLNESVWDTDCTFDQEKKPRSGLNLNGALDTHSRDKLTSSFCAISYRSFARKPTPSTLLLP